MNDTQCPTPATPAPPPPRYSSLRIAYKAFREVISVSPKWGILYPIFANITSLLELVQIFVFGRLIDNIMTLLQGNFVFTMAEFVHTPAFRNFIFIIVIYFFVSLSSKYAEYLQECITEEYVTVFRLNVMEQLSRLNLQDFEKRDLQNHLVNAPLYSQPAVLDTYFKLTTLFYNIVALVLASSIVITEMAWWGVLVGLFVIPEAYFRYRQNVRIKQYRDAESDRLKYFEYLFKHATMPQNFPELRVDNAFPFLINSYKESSDKYFLNLYRIRFVRNTGSFLLQWFDRLYLRLAQIALIPISIALQYSIGTFKYLFDYLEKVYDSAGQIITNSLNIKENILYVRDYFALLEYQGFGDVVSGTETLDPLKTPRIEFQNVSFSYPGSDSATVSQLSFVIESGKNIAIVGTDGSGKSTIAKLLCGLYEIGPGDILVDDISIRNLSRGELKRKISVAFERFNMFNFSIRKNITVAQSERDFNRRLYEEALEITGLDTWMRESAIDDRTILGKLFGGGIEISTGHWQRIAIARAIYQDCPVLVLDESLTQIDSFSRLPILEAIIKHRPNQTFINITQEIEHLDLFDMVIRVEKGRVVEN